MSSQKSPPVFIEKAKKNRLKNALSGLVFALIFLTFYLIGASRAPMGDNIGILVAPPILFFFYAPLISRIMGWIQLKRIVPNNIPKEKKREFFRNTQFGFLFGSFRITVISMAIISLLSLNPLVFLFLISLPFWPLGYLL